MRIGQKKYSDVRAGYALVLAVMTGVAAMGWADMSTAQSSTSIEQYWTPERLRTARPAPMPSTTFERLGTPVLPQGSDSHQSGEEFVPIVNPRRPRDSGTILHPDEDHGEAPQYDAEISPRMVGGRGYPFTTRRVSPNSTVTSDRYRRVGKLFYTAPDGDWSCSAAIIQRRLILTAAHCIHDREEKKYHTNFLFVPAHNGSASQSAPFCQWTGRSPRVTSRWRSSSGFPAVDDFGIVEIRERNCGGQTRRIGDYLGWFGWSTNSLLGNNITELGYPGNLDQGRRMQITQSNVYRRTSTIGEIGSAMSSGASGGPWVQNFGVPPSGQVAVGPSGQRGFNQIVAVRSFSIQAQHNTLQFGGANTLNSRFVTLFNAACARHSRNC